MNSQMSEMFTSVNGADPARPRFPARAAGGGPGRRPDGRSGPRSDQRQGKRNPGEKFMDRSHGTYIRPLSAYAQYYSSEH